MTAKARKAGEFTKKVRQRVAATPRPVLTSVAVILFAVIGTVLLVGSQAATPVANYEVEAGTRTGNAVAVGDSGASGGSAVQFSSTATSNSCALPKYPTAACTGVPAGWTPTTTINGDLVIRTDGTVIQDYLVTGNIDIRAHNVTIKRTRVYGNVDNFITNDIYGPVLIEDTEVVLPPGQTFNYDTTTAFAVANYTCRRRKVDGRIEAFRVGAKDAPGAGPVTIEDSYARIGSVQEVCDAIDPHGDGIQGYYGNFATIRHNTIDQRVDRCPTAPIFIPNQGNDGGNVTDNLLAGGGYTLRLDGGSFPNVTGNKIVDNSWGYGPIDVNCAVIGNWSGNAVVTYDWNTGTILSQVRALNDC